MILRWWMNGAGAVNLTLAPRDGQLIQICLTGRDKSLRSPAENGALRWIFRALQEKPDTSDANERERQLCGSSVPGFSHD